MVQDEIEIAAIGLEDHVEDIAEKGHGADGELEAVRAWLFGKATTIYGGSTEIQNNIIAKRVLGMLDHQ